MTQSDPTQLTLEEITRSVPVGSAEYFAAQLISQVQKELSQTKRHVFTVTIKWMVAFDYFKLRESELLLSESPFEEEKHYLIGFSTLLRGLGLILLSQLRQTKEIDLKSALGYDYDDIAACVDELSDLERIFTPTMTSEMMDDIGAKVFGAKK